MSSVKFLIMGMRRHIKAVVLRDAIFYCVIAFGCAFGFSADYLNYSVWSQIEFVRNMDEFSTAESYVHFSRYLAILPAYLVADLLGHPVDLIYSVYVVVTAIITSALWLSIRRRVSISRTADYLVALVPVSLLAVINGRFAFALFGLTLILYALVRARVRGVTGLTSVLLLAGFLFASVSSGVFTVAILFAVIDYLQVGRLGYSGLRKARVNWVVKAVIVCISFFCAALFVLFFKKNVDYYGGGLSGIYSMLSHGVGLVLNPEPLYAYCTSLGMDSPVVCRIAGLLVNADYVLVSLIFVAFLGAACFFILCVHNLPVIPLVKRGVFLSLAGGVFGITTLFSILFVLPMVTNLRVVRQVYR